MNLNRIQKDSSKPTLTLKLIRPDKTDNFSFRDQQAAQPNISNLKTKKDLPALEGVEFSSKVTPSSQQSSSLKKMPEVPEMQKPQKDNQETETKIKHTHTF